MWPRIPASLEARRLQSRLSQAETLVCLLPTPPSLKRLVFISVVCILYSSTSFQTTKRRSQGGDSKYGFPNKQSNGVDDSPGGGAGYSSGMFRGQNGDQLTGSPEAKEERRGQSKSKKEAGSLPVLPPKIDRQKKPSKKSAAERLFGRSSGDRDKGTGGGAAVAEEGPGEEAAEETPPETRVNGGFHSMPPSVSENNKKNTFDSNSSSNFDSYNKHAAAAEGGFNGYSRSLSQPGYAASGPRGPPTDKYR